MMSRHLRAAPLLGCCLLLLLSLSKVSGGQGEVGGRGRGVCKSSEGLPQGVTKNTTKTATTNDTALVAMEDEIEALEELIRLQTQKLEVLRRMRVMYLSGARPPSRRAQDMRRSMMADEAEREPSEGYGTSGPMSGGEEEVHSSSEPANYLLVRGQLAAPPEVTVLKTITFQMVREGPRKYRHAKSNTLVYKMVDLVAAGDRQGMVTFYDTMGEVVLQYDAAHNSPIAALDFDGQDADPLLVTAGADGSVHSHNVSLWRDEVMVAGRRPSVERAEVHGGPGGEPSLEAMKAFYLKPPARKTSSGYGLIVTLENKMESTEKNGTAAGEGVVVPVSPVASVLSYRHRAFNKAIVRGDLDGTLIFYARNGSIVKVYHSGRPVYDLQKNGLLVATTSESDVAFFQAFTMDPTGASCRGLLHSPIVSMAFDAISPSTLHAATKDGDILICDTRKKVLEDPSAFPLVRRIVTHTGEPLRLGSARGYLIAGTAKSLLVYNTTTIHTGGEVPLVFTYPWTQPQGSQGAAAPQVRPCPLTGTPMMSMSTTKVASTLPSHFAFLTDEDLFVYETILPFTRPKPMDVSWIRGPIMILAMGIVFLWQFNRKKASALAANRRASVPWEMLGSDEGLGGMEEDFDRALRRSKLDERELDFLKATVEGLKKRPGGGRNATTSSTSSSFSSRLKDNGMPGRQRGSSGRSRYVKRGQAHDTLYDGSDILGDDNDVDEDDVDVDDYEDDVLLDDEDAQYWSRGRRH